MLLNFNVLVISVKRWKKRPHSVGKNLLEVVNAKDRDFYPNISNIFLNSYPSSGFSALHWLKTWCRASMQDEQLNSNALVNIHRHHPLLLDLDTLWILMAWDSMGY